VQQLTFYEKIPVVSGAFSILKVPLRTFPRNLQIDLIHRYLNRFAYLLKHIQLPHIRADYFRIYIFPGYALYYYYFCLKSLSGYGVMTHKNKI